MAEALRARQCTIGGKLSGRLSNFNLPVRLHGEAGSWPAPQHRSYVWQSSGQNIQPTETQNEKDPDFRTHLGADIMEGVRRVKSQDGPDLIVRGSSTLTSVLIGQGLVNEVVLIAYPVLLGLGKRFISDNAEPRELAFVSIKAPSTGVLINTYQHVGLLQTKLSAGASS